jgi:hypothetical protein
MSAPPSGLPPPSAEAQQEALLKVSSRHPARAFRPATRLPAPPHRPDPDPDPPRRRRPQAKYGGLLPKKKMLKGAGQGYFDSADWQMGKQKGLPTPPPLRPKLAPAAAPLSPERRPSQLGDGLA